MYLLQFNVIIIVQKRRVLLKHTQMSANINTHLHICSKVNYYRIIDTSVQGITVLVK